MHGTYHPGNSEGKNHLIINIESGGGENLREGHFLISYCFCTGNALYKSLNLLLVLTLLSAGIVGWNKIFFSLITCTHHGENKIARLVV